VIAGRRSLAARHEFRVGNRELMIFAAIFVVICALTFVFGILVGREMTPASRAPRAEGPRAEEPRTESRVASGATPGSPSPAGKAEDHLTFYRTLTAPTLDLPPAEKPRIEERLVPSDDPEAATPPTAGASPDGSGPGRRAPAPPARAATTARPSISPPRPMVRTPAPSPPAAPPAAAATAPTATAVADPALWTVQVSAFRSRFLAEDLRARLGARGLDAYVVSSATEGGQVRYRVRVGAYASRGDAERVAAELRAERTLNPYVTPRAR